MMGTLLIETDYIELSILYSSPQELIIDKDLILQMQTNIRELNTKVPMVIASAIFQADIDYDFHVEAQDGRKLDQVLRVDDYDFEMTHDCPDFWSLSEYQKIVAVRDSFARLIIEYQMTETKFEWK